ncbi:MAG: hypothetical protein AAGA30_11020 [Planctomycetota bacterium]
MLKDVSEIKLSSDEEDNNSRRQSPRSGAFGAGSFGTAGVSGGGNRNPNRNATDNQPRESVLDRALGQATASKPEDDFTGTLIPGVTLLGKGSKAELIERAKEKNVDALWMFNVKISKSRGSRNRGFGGGSSPSQYSTTNLKIIDLKTGENLFSSKSLKDTDVKEDVDEGDDPVKDEIEKAFKSVADSKFKAEDLPSALKAEVVKKRVGRLLKSKPSNPLPTAVEVVSYYEADLMDEELAVAAMKKLFGSDDAAVLVAGPPKERLAFLKRWLPDEIELD